MDCRPPSSSVHGYSPGKKAGVGCHALLQVIFLTQGWNVQLLSLLLWPAGSLPLCATWEVPLSTISTYGIAWLLTCLRKSVLNIHWRDWCWSSNPNTLATWVKNWLLWKAPNAGKDRRWEKGVRQVEMVW